MKETGVITAQWVEVKSRIRKLMDDGLMKEANEVVCIDAATFSEAESKIIDYYLESVNEFESVVQMTRARYKEAFLHEPATNFYRCVVKILDYDEKTDKVRKQPVHYLVQASSLTEARQIVADVYSHSAVEYEFYSITKSPVKDIILHVSNN